MTHYPHIILRPISGFNFEVVVDCRVDELDITIIAGSVTNLTSAPRFFWWLIPPHGDTKAASIVHDYMIRSGHNSVLADCVFLYLLRLSVASWQAHIMYFCITFFQKYRKIVERGTH
jgi:hypothetical protein